MNAAATVINLAYVTVLLLAGVALVRLCRRPSEAERVDAARKRVGLRVWDMAAEEWVALPPGVGPGPGQLTAREVTDADPLELLYLAPAYDRSSAAIDEGLSNLFEALGPPPAYDPAWAAGLERLWDAVRDHHTNTPEGEA